MTVRIHTHDGDILTTNDITHDTAAGILTDPDGVFDVKAAYPSNRGRVLIPRANVHHVDEVTA